VRELGRRVERHRLAVAGLDRVGHLVRAAHEQRGRHFGELLVDVRICDAPSFDGGRGFLGEGHRLGRCGRGDELGLVHGRRDLADPGRSVVERRGLARGLGQSLGQLVGRERGHLAVCGVRQSVRHSL
jgi:hypothetical protein